MSPFIDFSYWHGQFPGRLGFSNNPYPVDNAHTYWVYIVVLPAGTCCGFCNPMFMFFIGHRSARTWHADKRERLFAKAARFITRLTWGKLQQSICGASQLGPVVRGVRGQCQRFPRGAKARCCVLAARVRGGIAPTTRVRNASSVPWGARAQRYAGRGAARTARVCGLSLADPHSGARANNLVDGTHTVSHGLLATRSPPSLCNVMEWLASCCRTIEWRR